MATKLTKPLIVIVGPTASGKTALAIEIAKKYNGEIICADSRTVYKGMDIGTAKPTVPERQGIPHHLLDVVEPDQKFTAADFKKLADEAIDDIQKRGKLPIMVGGSGLYIDAVIYDYNFRASNPDIRSKFQDASVEELQAELAARGIPLPQNDRNQRYLLRSLESGQAAPIDKILQPETLIIGLDIDRKILKSRIAARVDSMLQSGLIDEIKRLSKSYGWVPSAMQAPAYKSFRNYVDGHESLDQAVSYNIMFDARLAKKQRTWFKRNNSIQWIDDPSKYVDILTTFLNTR